MEEVTGECRKLHNEELHDMLSSPLIIWVIRMMRWVGYVAHVCGEEKCMQVFGGESWRKEAIWKAQM